MSNFMMLQHPLLKNILIEIIYLFLQIFQSENVESFVEDCFLVLKIFLKFYFKLIIFILKLF